MFASVKNAGIFFSGGFYFLAGFAVILQCNTFTI